MKNDTFVGIIIGILITVVVGYIYFGLSNKKREPVFSVINNPSLIFDKNISSPKIKLIVEDSIAIKENVYVITLVVWNKGRLAINKEDVRSDFTIFCSDNSSQILDYKILEEKESGTSNFKLTPIGNRLKIDWDYFDPGYGFKIQIIYTGTTKTQINAEGSVEGGKIEKGGYRTIKDTKRDRVSYYIVMFFMILFAGFSISQMSIKDVKAGGISRHVYFLLMIVVAIVISFLVTDVEGFLFREVDPPF